MTAANVVIVGAGKSHLISYTTAIGRNLLIATGLGQAL